MPRPPRFFISPDQIVEREVILTGDDLRHILIVLRMRPGDELMLLDGRGGEYRARIIKTGKAEIVTEIISETRKEIRPPYVTLCLGILKADKMDWVMQKATELGVNAIVPLVTERTIVKIKDQEGRLRRWQKIVREAAMQSNRLVIPIVGPIKKLSDLLAETERCQKTVRLFPWEGASRHIKDLLVMNPDPQSIIAIIGPEGGFSEREAEVAEAHGFEIVSLGPNILRAETAGLAVLSMILYEFGSGS